MNTLPNYKNAIIPDEKFINYALDFTKSPNKAEAFKSVLGYTKTNANKLIDEIYANIGFYEAISKGNNGYGELYEVILKLKGANGNYANVLTSWIVENGKNYPKLTSSYITKKKLRGEYK